MPKTFNLVISAQYADGVQYQVVGTYKWINCTVSGRTSVSCSMDFASASGFWKVIFRVFNTPNNSINTSEYTLIAVGLTANQITAMPLNASNGQSTSGVSNSGDTTSSAVKSAS
jgi:hypothetical protein